MRARTRLVPLLALVTATGRLGAAAPAQAAPGGGAPPGKQPVAVGWGGAVASVELITPNLLASREDPKTALRLLGFADAGKAFNQLDTPCRIGQSSCLLTSAGIGARLGYGSLQLRLDVAHALKTAIRTGSGDTRVHLQAIYSFQ